MKQAAPADGAFMDKVLSPLYAMATSLVSPRPQDVVPDPATNGVLHPQGCPWCGGRVYFNERVFSCGRDWHKGCLKCISCTKTLQPGQQLDHDKKPYCKPCHTRAFGPKGYGFGGAVAAEEHAAANEEPEVAEVQLSADPQLEAAMVDYVSAASGVGMEDASSVTVSLRDGVALCFFIHKLAPDALPKVPFPNPRAPWNELENIDAYLRACDELGVPQSHLFHPNDLHRGTDPDAVVANLQCVFEMAQDKGAFDGKLNGWMLEKRVREWMSVLSQVDVRVGDLYTLLHSGRVLCLVANAVQAGSVAPAHLKAPHSKFAILDTIAAFLEVRARHPLARRLRPGTNKESSRRARRVVAWLSSLPSRAGCSGAWGC